LRDAVFGFPRGLLRAPNACGDSLFSFISSVFLVISLLGCFTVWAIMVGCMRVLTFRSLGTLLHFLSIPSRRSCVPRRRRTLSCGPFRRDAGCVVFAGVSIRRLFEHCFESRRRSGEGEFCPRFPLSFLEEPQPRWIALFPP